MDISSNSDNNPSSSEEDAESGCEEDEDVIQFNRYPRLSKEEEIYGVFYESGTEPRSSKRKPVASKKKMKFVAKSNDGPIDVEDENEILLPEEFLAFDQVPDESSSEIRYTGLGNDSFRNMVHRVKQVPIEPQPAVKLIANKPGMSPGWTKHTKGFGMKMMEKMGYAGRGGLGVTNESGVGKGIDAPIEVEVRAESTGLGFGGSERQQTKQKQASQTVSQYHPDEADNGGNKPDLMEKLLRQSSSSSSSSGSIWRQRKSKQPSVSVNNDSNKKKIKSLVIIDDDDDVDMLSSRAVIAESNREEIQKSRVDNIAIIKRHALERSLETNKRKLIILSQSLSFLNDVEALMKIELTNQSSSPQSIVSLIDYVFSSLKVIVDSNVTSIDLIVIGALPNIISLLLTRYMKYWSDGDGVDDYDLLCLLTSISGSFDDDDDAFHEVVSSIVIPPIISSLPSMSSDRCVWIVFHLLTSISELDHCNSRLNDDDDDDDVCYADDALSNHILSPLHHSIQVMIKKEMDDDDDNDGMALNFPVNEDDDVVMKIFVWIEGLLDYLYHHHDLTSNIDLKSVLNDDGHTSNHRLFSSSLSLVSKQIIPSISRLSSLQLNKCYKVMGIMACDDGVGGRMMIDELLMLNVMMSKVVVLSSFQMKVASLFPFAKGSGREIVLQLSSLFHRDCYHYLLKGLDVFFHCFSVPDICTLVKSKEFNVNDIIGQICNNLTNFVNIDGDFTELFKLFENCFVTKNWTVSSQFNSRADLKIVYLFVKNVFLEFVDSLQFNSSEVEARCVESLCKMLEACNGSGELKIAPKPSKSSSLLSLIHSSSSSSDVTKVVSFKECLESIAEENNIMFLKLEANKYSSSLPFHCDQVYKFGKCVIAIHEGVCHIKSSTTTKKWEPVSIDELISLNQT